MGELEDLKEKVHYVSVTGIIRRGDTFLICRRSPHERIFPEKWCVPGGKIQLSDFVHAQKDTKDHWLGVFERVLRKEVLEETGLTVRNIGYVSNLALLRPNGFSTIIVSLCADYDSGKVILSKDELVDHAWVTLEEAKQYDLIENIYEQLQKVATMRLAPKSS